MQHKLAEFEKMVKKGERKQAKSSIRCDAKLHMKQI